MHVSLICVVLMAAASSVLSYDVNLWGLRQQSRTQAEQKSEKIQQIKALVNELSAMEEQRESRDLASCLAINDVLKVAQVLVGSVVNAVPPTATGASPVDPGALLNLALSIPKVVTNILGPLVQLLTGTASCLLGAIGNLLTSLLSTLTALLPHRQGGLPDPTATVTTIVNFVLSLVQTLTGVVAPAIATVLSTLTGLLSILAVVNTLVSGLNLTGLLSTVTGLLNVSNLVSTLPIGSLLQSVGLGGLLSTITGLLSGVLTGVVGGLLGGVTGLLGGGLLSGLG